MIYSDIYRVQVNWFGHTFWVERQDKAEQILDLVASICSEVEFLAWCSKWSITVEGYASEDAEQLTTILTDGAWVP